MLTHGVLPVSVSYQPFVPRNVIFIYVYRNGAGEWIRTIDLRFTKPLLYRLSYASIDSWIIADFLQGVKEEDGVFIFRMAPDFRKKKLTQEGLAQACGLDYKYIQRLEGKKPSSPTLNSLEKLAKSLDISIAKLLNLK